jgi:amino acid adenylation domain-containing protein
MNLDKDSKRKLLLSLLENRSQTSSTNNKDIAVIGLNGRYPQSPTLNNFWDNLCGGKTCISDVPEERWNWRQYVTDDATDFSLRRAGFIGDVDKFDPLFFGISPREAERMDPQERLFLECAWHTVEDAGYTPDELNADGRQVGVFAGVMNANYSILGSASWKENHLNSKVFACNPTFWSIANRVSFTLNFTGPSFAVDSACSSSLTAIQLACESLRKGECDLALAGGVNLILHPAQLDSLAKMKMLSKKGNCHSFGAESDGFTDGEGVGAVLLKPLSKAIEDNDNIYGVIKSGALNSGGRTSGYTVPNPNAQAALIERAMDQAGIRPRDISYIEAHGTGTQLGDPIEIRGLTKAFRKSTQDKTFCALGSVKSNIGHLESAAGISALTKVLLQFKHQKLVPSIHADEINSNIDFGNSPFYLQQGMSDWNIGEIKYAGISSFGAGGANAHLVLQNHISRSLVDLKNDGPYLIYLSAQSQDQLKRYARSLSTFLLSELSTSNTDITLLNVAYTLFAGRISLSSRLAIVANDLKDLHLKLDHFVAGDLKNNGVFFGETEQNNTNDVENINSINTDTLDILAKKWVFGEVEKSRNCFTNKTARRVSLPGYPFLRERYWINAAKVGAGLISTAADDSLNNSSSEQDEDLIYISTKWVNQPLSTNSKEPVGRRLVFCETLKQIDILATDNLNHANTTWIIPGVENRNIQGNTYSVSFASKELMFEGLEKILGPKKSALDIIFGLPQDGSKENESGIRALLFLSQFLITQQIDHQTSILVWNSIESPNNGISGYAVAGFVKSVRQERSRLRIKQINFPGGTKEYSLPAQLNLLNTEIKDFKPSEIVVRYLDGERSVEKLHLQQNIKASANRTIRPKCTYLITGGAGGLGSLVARNIALQGNVNIVLTGRSPLDNLKQKLIADLKALENEVIYYSCDLSDSLDVNKLFEKIKNRYGKLDGVIHSAGTLNDGLVQGKTWNSFKNVTDPKVSAILNIDSITENQELDFFVVFSSVTSILGNIGQTDYAYANSFLDYFTQWRNERVTAGERKGTSFSINWPIWDQGGMHIDPGVLKSIEENIGIIPLGTSMGISSFLDILESNVTQVAPIYGKVSKIISYLNSLGVANIIAEKNKKSVEESPVAKINKQIAEQSSHASREKIIPLLIASLRELTSDTLSIPLAKINNDKVLVDYGFDSITIQEFSSRLKQQFKINISPAIFFARNTLTKIADYLIENFPGELTSELNISVRLSTEEIEQDNKLNSVRPTKIEAVSSAEIFPSTSVNSLEIAIIGMEGILPGAKNLEEFWENLKHGIDTITEIPADRWDWRDHYGEAFGTPNKSNSKWGGFISDVDKFDYEFFELSKKEANFMDPQQRLFVQTVWNAIENSGYNPFGLKNETVGVFAGVEFSDYKDLLDNYGHYQAEMAIGTAHNMIPNRVSYFLDLHGPSEAIDTACSSSLVAINRAIRSIQSGESSMAIAGGISLSLSPKTMIGTSQLNIYSSDGRCKTLDKNANGYVKGEGVGVVILKPLNRAIADNDNIIAIIKSCTVNHGGRSNSITAPNPEAQTDLLVKAYKDAKVFPKHIRYIEMHGTGTKLGDPVEVEGIKGAFRKLSTSTQNPEHLKNCGIGSVKTNIGHLEPAAGIAGLLKVLLSLKHKQLPPTLHFEELNPLIQLENSPLYVVNKLQDISRHLDKTGQPIPFVAGVSSFGFGGSNAHIVVEEWLGQGRNHNDVEITQPQVFILSAKTQHQLQDYALSLIDFLATNPTNASLSSMIFTLQTGRQAMTTRLAIVTSSMRDLAGKLIAFTDGKMSQGIYTGNREEHRCVLDDLQDTDFQEHLLKKNDAHLLAKWWVKGLEINWLTLYTNSSPNRVPLPTYPFSRQSCWIPRDKNISISQFAMVAQENKPHQPIGKKGTHAQIDKAPLVQEDNVATRILKKVAEVSGKRVSEIKTTHNLAMDLGLDSIKMMGLINDLISRSSDEKIQSFNKLGMTAIINKARSVESLIDIFLGDDEKNYLKNKNHEITKVVENSPANKALILDAQAIFFPAYFLTKSSSLCSYVEIEGKVDPVVATRVWHAMIERHPSLQLKFNWPSFPKSTLGDISAEFIDDFTDLKIPVIDISDLSSEQKSQYINEYFHERLNAQWKLDTWPLHEISIIQKSADECAIFWSNEHIISDGLSNQIALKEFLTNYSLMLNCQELPDISLSTREEYSKIIECINSYKQADVAILDAYSANQPYEFNPENSLRDINKARFANIKTLLSSTQTHALFDFSGTSRFSVNSILTCAFVKTLSKFDHSSAVTVQVPTSGRTYPGLDLTSTIGCFAQNLSLSLQLVKNDDDLHLLNDIQTRMDDSLISAADHFQTRALRKIIESIPLTASNQLPDYSRDMLIASVKSNIYFPYTGKTGIKSSYADLNVTAYTAGTSNSPGAIDFLQEIHDDQLHIFVNYDESYFSRTLIQHLINSYIDEITKLTGSNVQRNSDIKLSRTKTKTLTTLIETLQGLTHSIVQEEQWASDFESVLGIDSLTKIKFINSLQNNFSRPINKRKLVQCRTLVEMQFVLDQEENSIGSQSLEVVEKTHIAPDENYVISQDLSAEDMPIRHIINQCLTRPYAIAVTHYSGQSITYGDLHEKSNKIANLLIDHGVKRGDYVGLTTHRGPAMLVSILAILKCGAAYVPMDPMFPADRMKYVVQHARIKVLLSESALIDRIADLLQLSSVENAASTILSKIVMLDFPTPTAIKSLEMFNVEILQPLVWSQYSANLPDIEIQPDDDMVVLFTSGSTGNPKGVFLHHRGYANRLMWHQKIFQLKPGEKVAQKTSCSFDVAIWEHLWPLMYGGVVCAVEKDIVSNPWEFADWLVREKISIAHFVPSMFGEFVNALANENQHFPSLRWLIFSGEALPAATVKKWISQHGLTTGLCNLYGPTEASIDVSYYFIDAEVDDKQSIPIGKAIDNTVLFVRDELGNILPTGKMGELCIAGLQLAKGYLYEPELTAKAFIPNIYEGIPGQTIYRTGDLAIELDGGVFEYHGRQDNQVKLRGFRVELGEIENVASGHPDIDEAAALVIDEKLFLCYAGKQQDGKLIKSHIASKCPSYMIPHVVIRLDKLPKNSNGKLDRKALLNSLKSTDAEKIELIKVNEDAVHTLPLGPAQKWIFSYFPAPYSWWGCSKSTVPQDFDVPTFEKTLGIIVKKHDALRTLFIKDEKVAFQQILATTDTPRVLIKDYSNLNNKLFEKSVSENLLLVAESIVPDVWPLFKVVLYRGAGGHNELAWIGHHLISDLISGFVINRDIWSIYNTIKHSTVEPLVEAKPSYSDYVKDVQKTYADSDQQAIRDFWQRYCVKRKGAIKIPFDHKKGMNNESSQEQISISLPAKTVNYLQIDGREFFNTSFYNLLCAPLYKLLSIELRRSWIVVSHKLNGRGLTGSSNNYLETVGNFAINVPVGITLKRNSNFNDIVTSLSNEIENLPMGGISYDWISDQLPVHAYPDSELTGIRCNYLGDISASVNDTSEISSRLSPPQQKRTTQLEFFFYTRDKTTYLDISFSCNFYKRDTIKRLSERYLEQLNALAEEITPEIFHTN